MIPDHSSISSSEAMTAPKHSALRPGRLRKFPLAALGALAIIIALEMGVWHYRYRIWEANYILLEQKREVLTGGSEPDDIAILGSSRFYHLRPEAIGDLFGPGTKVTNYSWSWSCLETYEVMLRGLIAAGRTPDIVVVDGIPEIFGYSERYLTAAHPEAPRWFYHTVPLMAGLRTEIGQKQWKVAWDLLVHFYTPPSSLYRDAVFQGLKTLLSSRHLPPFPVYNNPVGDWQRQGWFLFAPAEHVAGAEEFKALEKDTGPYIFREHEHIRYIYQRFVKLAQENDVEVIMLPVPNNPLVYDAFNRGGIYTEYDKWLDYLERKYINFSAPAPRYFTWPNMLGDAGHVNAAGAERHMELVIDLLSTEFKRLELSGPTAPMKNTIRHNPSPRLSN